MDGGKVTITQALAENVPSLTEKEKLEIVNQQWLLDHAPPDSQAYAVARLHSLLENGSDARVVMQTIRETSMDLQRAIEDTIARLHVLTPTGARMGAPIHRGAESRRNLPDTAF